MHRKMHLTTVSYTRKSDWATLRGHRFGQFHGGTAFFTANHPAEGNVKSYMKLSADDADRQRRFSVFKK